MRSVKLIINCLATLVQVVYFVFFFLLVYWPVYVFVFFWAKNRNAGFQAATHYYLKIFFLVVRLVAPGLKIRIRDEDRIASLKSSIIICNHISYLDPLLIISVIKHAVSLVHEGVFQAPIFGWVATNSGFLSSSIESEDEFWSDKIIGRMKETLAVGGNIFIFPEGTRSKAGKLGRFKKGAFFFAGKLDAPVEMLHVRGTDELYPPQKKLLDVCRKTTIELRYIGSLSTGDNGARLSVIDIKDKAQGVYRQYESELEETE